MAFSATKVLFGSKVPKKVPYLSPAKKKTWAPEIPVYLLRTCSHRMRDITGFEWPRPSSPLNGYVEASCWGPGASYGDGLHGLLHGEGRMRGMPDPHELDGETWLIILADLRELVHMGSYVKAPRGRVVYAGGRATILTRLAELRGSWPTLFKAERTYGGTELLVADTYRLFPSPSAVRTVVGEHRDILSYEHDVVAVSDGHSREVLLRGEDTVAVVRGSLTRTVHKRGVIVLSGTFTSRDIYTGDGGVVVVNTRPEPVVLTIGKTKKLSPRTWYRISMRGVPTRISAKEIEQLKLKELV